MLIKCNVITLMKKDMLRQYNHSDFNEEHVIQFVAQSSGI